ncbi:hypothetical protein [Sorangium sp. So ce426]|uniref:hypothetical protein n=1 Tax=unclassified Sorangium TaxID=2621164 RepID=UPI003F5C183D
MKKLATFAILPALGLVLSPGDVSAGATMNGAACHLVNGIDVLRASNAILNQSSNPITIHCAIPIDHQLGGTVTFRVRMSDGNDLDGMNTTCVGLAHDQDGNDLGSTSAMVSGTGTFTGTVTRTATLTVSPQSASHMYSVSCAIPGGGSSGLFTARVF